MVCGAGDVCVCGVGKFQVSKPIHCVDRDSQWRREVKTSTPAPLRAYIPQGPGDQECLLMDCS